MAANDLTSLRHELPDLFEDRELPPGLEDSWFIMPCDDPQATTADDLYAIGVEGPDTEAFGLPDTISKVRSEPEDLIDQEESVVPDSPEYDFPGMPVPTEGYIAPPPDALAFYLPFHYYYPDWWGIYLVVEGIQVLADAIWDLARPTANYSDALITAKVYLYAHEAFHHNVESFATRLEVTHRVPLYKEGFELRFQRTYAEGECPEEALADAYAYRKVMEFFNKDANKKLAIGTALQVYMRGCPPPYDRGLEYAEDHAFTEERLQFAEDNEQASLPHLPQVGRDVWRLFSHSFTGIARINSRVNYLVHEDSPIAARDSFRIRGLRYRDLAKRLKKLTGATPERQKGSHEIWRHPNGASITVPRHAKDFKTGTLKSILRQAGINMSVTQFCRPIRQFE